MTNLLIDYNTNTAVNNNTDEYTFTEYFYEDYGTYILCETSSSTRYVIKPQGHHLGCNCEEWHNALKTLSGGNVTCSHIKAFFKLRKIGSLSEYFDYEQLAREDEAISRIASDQYDSYED